MANFQKEMEEEEVHQLLPAKKLSQAILHQIRDSHNQAEHKGSHVLVPAVRWW